jgi:hemerythrin-like domain-containing protein
MTDTLRLSRRKLLLTGATSLAALSALSEPVTAKASNQDVEATPLEDLMHEHGVLNRLLLIFDETHRRISQGTDFMSDALKGAAIIMRDYIQAHHEVIEEEFVFPQLVKANKYPDIVATLVDQHKAGRVITKSLINFAELGGSIADNQKAALSGDLKALTRMFRPHEAWEDSVIYPAFRDALGKHKYHEFGEVMERAERERFGEEGLDKVVAQVAEIEKKLGIFNLAQFTPSAHTANSDSANH